MRALNFAITTLVAEIITILSAIWVANVCSTKISELFNNLIEAMEVICK